MVGESEQSVNATRLRSILSQVPQPNRVLELGCGDCSEVPLTSMSGALYIGVDIDLDALRRAIRQQIAIQQTRIPLIQADITRLPFRAEFDLILIRHPDVDQHHCDWERIFMGIAHLLTTSGTLIVTTYSVPEIEIINSWLSDTRLIRLPLDTARLLEPDLVGRDRFVIVYQKIQSR